MNCPVCKEKFDNSLSLAMHIAQTITMECEHNEFRKNVLGGEKSFKPLAYKIDSYFEKVANFTH